MSSLSTTFSAALFWLLGLLLAQDTLAFNGTFFLSQERELFGRPTYYVIQDDEETLAALARKHDLGFNEIVAANPGIEPWYPGKGTRVLIPTSWILPELSTPTAEARQKPAEGTSTTKDGCILINLAELRLYVVRSQGSGLSVTTFPIGIGREGFETPVGEYSIIEKIEEPSWTVPESIRAESPELPAVVPPGPDNPLGTHALRLSNPSYLIHGTNKPLGVGRKVSHGCIRMYPEDIKILHGLSRAGDKVRIVYQPVKVGIRDKKAHVEIHGDDSTGGGASLEALDLLVRAGLENGVDLGLLKEAVAGNKGVPVPLTRVGAES